MGKSTLLIVLAAILGASTLFLSTRVLTQETREDRSQAQADLLARDAATSGHGLVLNAMLAEDGGFETSAPYAEENVTDGWFSVDSYDATTDAAGTQTVTYTVTGHSGGATHTITSTYAYDPLDYPGPLWLDVPYVTASVTSGTRIDGGSDNLNAHFDERQHQELGLGSLLPLGTMDANMTANLGGASGRGGDFQGSNMLAAGLLDDVNVSDASDLYHAALDAIGASDVTLAGGTTLTSTQNYGSGQKIVRVTGPLTLGDGGRLEGTGVLVVEGPINLTHDSARLDWNGLVIIHTEAMYLHLDWTRGRVAISGGLVVDQQAVPPGGHLDVTTMRDLDGDWESAAGDHTDSPWLIYSGGPYPFFQHKHRYDLDLGTTDVLFRSATADSREFYTQFRDALSRLGTQQVFLEFDNTAYHGNARYALDLDGQPEVVAGAVKNGFGALADGTSAYRSQPFAADDVRAFNVDVRSLRLLRQRFDEEDGCAQWPLCIGPAWNRGDALTVRLREVNEARSHPTLYEAALYWHMRTDEVAEHNAEEAALRTAIQGGALFGTRLDFGDDVDLSYDHDEITDLADRLGFDNDQVLLLSSSSEHTTVDEHTAAGTSAPSGPSSSGGSATPSSPFCHRVDAVPATIMLSDPTTIVTHLQHGDTHGVCR
ncbi:MAG: hypothetical protein HKN04_11210 [Rhodothermaceae bacterium]|nr:hypothetical protein [Rhodothermaceae bacterium]